MFGEYGDVICTSQLYSQHEGLHGDLSTKGECYFMVEDAPATIEHGRRRHVMGIVRGMVPREVPIRGIHSASSQQVKHLAIGRSYSARVQGPFYGISLVCLAH